MKKHEKIEIKRAKKVEKSKKIQKLIKIKKIQLRLMKIPVKINEKIIKI